MANIIFNEKTREFHLQNDRISYILCILEMDNRDICILVKG